MADMNDPNPLPPGWDCKYDPRTARYYYINYFTKTTTWDDPRFRYRQLQNHGTPIHHNSAIGECLPMQELNTVARTSPLASRGMQQLTSRLQETSLTAVQDTEQLVTKIGSMFPTVTETHIRLLLKKYYNREAVVMSALQVEKHPISTPGPYSTPPPPVKHFSPHTGPRGGSPVPRPGSGGSGSFVGSPRFGDAFRSSPRPHSSPKMKLRYMKSIFPSVEETILLDILSNNENNVQKASEALLAMGFEKRDMKPPRLQARKSEEERVEAAESVVRATLPPRMRSLEEKNKMKIKLQEDYKNIPEQVISIALESVNYDADRANQILQIMVQEDNKPRSSSSGEATPEPQRTVETEDVLDTVEPTVRAVTPEPSPPKIHEIIDVEVGKTARNKTRNGSVKTPSRETSIEHERNEYYSTYITKPTGPKPTLQTGPNDEILLSDYVTWNGANPHLMNGRNVTLAKGPNQTLLQSRGYQAKGPNNSNRKGPLFGLAKGSIYSQLKAVLCETRGK